MVSGVAECIHQRAIGTFRSNSGWARFAALLTSTACRCTANPSFGRPLSVLGVQPARAIPPADASFASLRRLDLDATAWVDHAPGWLAGHEALLEHLVRTTRWQQPRREMYDRTVDVPRLVASLPDDGPGHPVLDDMRAALAR